MSPVRQGPYALNPALVACVKQECSVLPPSSNFLFSLGWSYRGYDVGTFAAELFSYL